MRTIWTSLLFKMINCWLINLFFPTRIYIQTHFWWVKSRYLKCLLNQLKFNFVTNLMILSRIQIYHCLNDPLEKLMYPFESNRNRKFNPHFTVSGLLLIPGFLEYFSIAFTITVSSRSYISFQYFSVYSVSHRKSHSTLYQPIKYHWIVRLSSSKICLLLGSDDDFVTHFRSIYTTYSPNITYILLSSLQQANLLWLKENGHAPFVSYHPSMAYIFHFLTILNRQLWVLKMCRTFQKHVYLVRHIKARLLHEIRNVRPNSNFKHQQPKRPQRTSVWENIKYIRAEW